MASMSSALVIDRCRSTCFFGEKASVLVRNVRTFWSRNGVGGCRPNESAVHLKKVWSGESVGAYLNAILE
jgi:hypothetical protein